MFTALLIVSLAAIVVMALYHYQLKGTGLKRGARAFIYVFLIVLAVVFVHHYAVMRCARAEAMQQGVRDIFTSIEQSRATGGAGTVPVVPMGFENFAEEVPVVAAVGGATGGVVAGGAADAAGGCGCPVAGGVRPDNIALDGDLVIEDVVIPTTVGPFGGVAR